MNTTFKDIIGTIMGLFAAYYIASLGFSIISVLNRKKRERNHANAMQELKTLLEEINQEITARKPEYYEYDFLGQQQFKKALFEKYYAKETKLCDSNVRRIYRHGVKLLLDNAFVD